jgi:hypothetical protein
VGSDVPRFTDSEIERLERFGETGPRLMLIAEPVRVLA